MDRILSLVGLDIENVEAAGRDNPVAPAEHRGFAAIFLMVADQQGALMRTPEARRVETDILRAKKRSRRAMRCTSAGQEMVRQSAAKSSTATLCFWRREPW